MAVLAGTALVALSSLLAGGLDPPRGVTRTVFLGPGLQGPQLGSAEVVDDINLEFIEMSVGFPALDFVVRWDGYWYLPTASAVDLHGAADDRVVVRIDGDVILERDTFRSSFPSSVTHALEGGTHYLEVEFVQRGGAHAMGVMWALSGEAPAPFSEAVVFPTRPSPDTLRRFDRLTIVNRLAVGVWSAVVGLLAWLFVRPAVGRIRARYLTAPPMDRVRAIVGPAAGVSYLYLLVRWFGDPGSPDADGLLYRTGQVWPTVAATGGFLFAVLWLDRGRVARMGRDLASLLDRYDAALLAVLTVGFVVVNLPVFSGAAGYLDSDSALHGIAAKHIWDGLVPPPFVYGMAMLGTFSSHVLAGTFAVVGPSVTALIVLSRIYWWIFVLSHYATLRLGFGRAVAGSVAAWMAFPGAFLTSQVTYTEFGELFAFGGLAVLFVTSRVTERLRDNRWYGVAGLALGLAVWSHPQGFILVAALALAMYLLRGGRHLVDALPWLVGGGLLGVLPALVGWGRNVGEFLSWLFLDGSPFAFTLGARLEAIAREALPVLFLGYWQPVRLSPLSGLAIGLVVAGSLAWGSWVSIRTWWRGARLRDSRQAPLSRDAVATILAVIALAAWVGFLGSRFGELIFPPRRLMLLYMAVPGLLAISMTAVLARLPVRVASFAVVLMMTAWIAGSNRLVEELVEDRAERGAHLAATVESLRREGVAHCEAPYWTAYWLTFATLEEIRCAQYEHDRDPYYRDLLERRAPEPERAYVGYVRATGGRRWIEGVRRGFDRAGVSYRHVVNPQFEVVLPEAP